MSIDLISNLRIGVRNSPIARGFAALAESAMIACQPSISIEIGAYVSEADRIKGSLAAHGGKRNFVKNLECRLLNHEIDIAVHALKDMPGDVPMHEDLAVGAYLQRHDPRDCLILRDSVTEADLGIPDIFIGTSAPRRRAIVRRWFPQARCELIRGNIDTRLRKLDMGQFHALILAASGVDLLQMGNRICRRFSFDEVLPAIGQGIICLQIRRGDLKLFSFLSQVNDANSSYCARAERQILHILGGNCHSAIAGLCELDHTLRQAHLRSMVFEMDGDAILVAEATQSLDSPDPVQLGTLVGSCLLEQGASHFL